MGRKIPGKKHRTIKDPEKQRALRVKSVKNKINAPPIDPEQQDMPKSLQRIVHLKEKAKNENIFLKRKKNKRSNDVINSDPNPSKSTSTAVKANVKRLGRPKEVTPNFKQFKGESNRSFMNRVNETVQTVLKESKFEDKYGVTVKRNIQTGEIEGVEKRPRDEIDDLIKEAQKSKKKKKTSTEPKLTKSQKKQLKIQEKKNRKAMNKGMDFDDFKDTVEFGDIVSGPPSLIAPRRVNKTDCAPRPGTKDLLLKSVFKSNEKTPKIQFPQTNKQIAIHKVSSDGKIDKTGKRKDLPNAVRRQLESHRNEVVNAYRIMKEKKIKRTE